MFLNSKLRLISTSYQKENSILCHIAKYSYYLKSVSNWSDNSILNFKVEKCKKLGLEWKP